MYKKFSDLYDELVFDIDYEKYSKNIFEIMNKYNINSGNILEIGCGTGNLTKKLAQKKDFKILAFDNSIEMLNHAFVKLQKYKNVNVVMMDMYKFNYSNYEFDAIITLLDVINYITDKDKLIKLFSNIYDGLKEGGTFIFDLNSKYKLFTILDNNHFIYERKNIFYTWENQRNDNLVKFYINFFVKNKNGFYERIEEIQTERYYSIEEIVSILENIGFKDIKYVDEDGGDFIEEKTQRILFSCIK